MTTRDTSREAFEELIRSGKLGPAQGKILRAVVGGADRTSGEICASLGLDNVNAWRARFTELQARGLIVESGTRKCKITGRTAITWRYTDRSKPLEAQHRVSGAKLRELLKRAAKLLQAHGGGAATSAAELLEEVKGAGIRF
jgi:predicted ArsR family transcriptional regulator